MNETVTSGALLLALPLAVLGGLVSFFSPCVLPLVPGYLSYVTGVTGTDLAESRRGRMTAGAVLFVLGFTAVFVSGGALFGYFGSTLQEYRGTLTTILGVLMILMGVFFLGLMPWFTQREFRFHKKPVAGLVGAPLLGALFGIGWTPCIGPTLASVNALALEQASAGRGAILAFAYCLGLGVPFVLAAIAFRKALGAFGWVKKHYVWVMRIGGGMMLVTGVLLLTGAWDSMVATMQGWSSGFTVGI
ncbi:MULTISPECIES: cytochrome c biogenesis CcdA family protein [Streptomyces]|uniref:Cytochrome c-type biogenesis protein CcdA n=1 Tax=Streptomyces venezuelae (strain ATCC 10712 / CBS 650.69 / DSM 40230 / JCM 4526 / NBRC 13096 / PD 04745) TaxID=953739 RepID=F2R8W8_STRVP|nr:cytochrome c biogenesis protein CcdA [Streptomyces venezuelae]APE22274.1 cytochrome C biogenesis protein ResC [Streptomyces venezuelae]QER99658.1 cytochrome C biogenesis protein CcdA [Streptomyces venezuelae ATCC 10712]QES06676.1 cytochrome C biogenesis protein CcdA [Streptomyces venezuelae]QES14580.1 cytochrome C biogenesis protein CcdA [Streptomyces venezuelae]CCA56428.1 Cytochrome c-type biogenesis protein CcdA [Streptomyces venezuelae ATCC 10712]